MIPVIRFSIDKALVDLHPAGVEAYVRAEVRVLYTGPYAWPEGWGPGKVTISGPIREFRDGKETGFTVYHVEVEGAAL